MKQMRILIADQQPKVRFALNVLLQNQKDYLVVGHAANTGELLSHLQQTAPDIILLDSNLPGMPIAELIQTIQCRSPKIPTLVMSANPESQQTLLSFGADDYVSKNEAASHLLEILRRFSVSSLLQ
jgi:DNA-binding NarL/FixJ family response regulator